MRIRAGYRVDPEDGEARRNLAWVEIDGHRIYGVIDLKYQMKYGNHVIALRFPADLETVLVDGEGEPVVERPLSVVQ